MIQSNSDLVGEVLGNYHSSVRPLASATGI